jgi:FixJ family two-component response regulator
LGKDQELAQNQIVAIVDDDEMVRSSVASLLRSLGLSTRTFMSADEYLKADDTRDVVCLLTDVQMPGTSGLQLQRILATRPSPPPVILMTAFPSDRVRSMALEAGALCFLEKPVDEKHLLACLGRVIDDIED